MGLKFWRQTCPRVRFFVRYPFSDSLYHFAAKGVETGLTNVPPKKDLPANKKGTLRFSGYLYFFYLFLSLQYTQTLGMYKT